MSLCQFCLTSDAKYSCPGCNHSYCGINCYRSLSHSQCSEAFYKECVQSELSEFSDFSKNRERTNEILQRAKTAAESDNLLLDSDDEEDLSDRITNIDLENSEKLWEVLTPEEQQDFKRKLNSGELYKLVPPEERNEDSVWWEICLPQRKITDISNEDSNDLHSCLPRLIEASVDIDTSSSSPLVEFNLINVLFAYAVTYRHLSWQTLSQEILPEETHDFLTSILNVSSNLSNDENFASSDMAITSGALKANQMPNMNPELVKAARSDVMDIIRGPGGSDEYDDSLYMLAALSDLKAIITKVKDKYIKNENFSRKRCVLVIKKIDYFMCWVRQHAIKF